MTLPAFRSPTSLHPEGYGQLAMMPSRKESLAIVSTSSKLCGIAAYTAALRRQLDDAYDITVFDLDQYLMRNPHRRVRRLADRRVKEFAARSGGSMSSTCSSNTAPWAATAPTSTGGSAGSPTRRRDCPSVSTRC
jgi:hypothetical protein